MEEEIIKGKPIKWVVTNVEAREDYMLILTFITGEKRIFDANVLLQKELYSSLKDVSIFLKVYVNGGSIAWSDDLDIAPEYLYENSKPI